MYFSLYLMAIGAIILTTRQPVQSLHQLVVCMEQSLLNASLKLKLIKYLLKESMNQTKLEFLGGDQTRKIPSGGGYGYSLGQHIADIVVTENSFLTLSS